MLTDRRGGFPGRLSALVVALAIIASACGGDEASQAPSTSPPPADTTAVVQTLADAGIAVLKDADATAPLTKVAEPRSPIELLEWQAQNLALDLAGQTGSTAADIDDLGRAGDMPDNAPISLLIGGWAAAVDTPGARYARTLLDDADWTDRTAVVMPDLVLLLFVSDLVMAQAKTAARDTRVASIAGAGLPDAGRVVPLAATAPPTVCATVQTWASNIIGSLNDLLTAPPGEGFLGMLSDAWNAAVGLAKDAFLTVLQTLGGQVIQAVQKIAAAIGILTWTVSFLESWTLELAAAPADTHFAHPGEADGKGTITATVKADAAAWPTTVIDCARLAGITLPDPSPPGKAITWSAEAPSGPVKLASIDTDGQTDKTIGADGKAKMHFTVSRELPVDTEGAEFHEAWLVTARVQRMSDADYHRLLDNLILPGPVGMAASILLEELSSEVNAKINHAIQAKARITVRVGFHKGGGDECLTGYWEADRESYTAFLQQVFGGAGELTSVSGSLTRVYVGDSFVERDDLLIGRRSFIGPRDRPTHVISTLLTMSGDTTGTYKVQGKRTDPAGTVAYSGTASDISTTAVVTVDGVVSEGMPFDLVPQGLQDEQRTYECHGDTFVETWQGGAFQLLWRRDTPGGPVEDWGTTMPDTEPKTQTGGFVTVKLDGKEHTFNDATCSEFDIGGLRYFTIRAGSAHDPAAPTAQPGEPPLATDAFQMTLILTQQKPYEAGTGAPSGRVDHRTFSMKPDTVVGFETEFLIGTFRGEEKGSTTKVVGSFQC